MIRVIREEQVCQEISASKETRVAKVCLGSLGHEGSQAPWEKLVTKVRLGFQDHLALRAFQGTSARREKMALKA